MTTAGCVARVWGAVAGGWVELGFPETLLAPGDRPRSCWLQRDGRRGLGRAGEARAPLVPASKVCWFESQELSLICGPLSHHSPRAVGSPGTKTKSIVFDGGGLFIHYVF